MPILPTASADTQSRLSLDGFALGNRTFRAGEFTIASAAGEKEIIRRLDMLKGVDFADAEEGDLTIAAMLIKFKLYSNALQALAPLTDKSVSPLVHVLRFQAYDRLNLKNFAHEEKLAQGNSGDVLKAQWQQAESLPE